MLVEAISRHRKNVARRIICRLGHIHRCWAMWQHRTAAASLKIQLDSLANDEEMLPLAPVVSPVAAAAGVTTLSIRKAGRCGGAKRGADGPIDPLAKRPRARG